MPPRPPRRLGACLFAAVVLLPAAAGFARQHPELLKGPALFANVFARVRHDALDSLGTDVLYERAARGLVRELGDPYAALYAPEDLARFTREELGGAYGGVGVLLEDQQGRPTVNQVYPNTPAARAGLARGDRLLTVDSVDVRGLALEAVTRRLLGRVGTPVHVTFERAGARAPRSARLVRAAVHVPAVPFTMLLEQDVGYVPLLRVSESAAVEVEASLAALAERGARAFVLDLRGNGGGSVEQSLAISELFLPPGRELARLRLRGDSVVRYASRRAPLVPDAPVAVLTDERTASAAEIVAGALQDHDRALVVGAPTFGKGLVQSVFALDGGWALKLTTGRWYTPSGRSIQRDRSGGDSALRVVAAVDDTARYYSDAGRPLRGGGGIVPDVAVAPDTLTTDERRFVTALAPVAVESYVALYDLAREWGVSVAPDFAVTPAWRAAYRARLDSIGVRLEPGVFERATPLVDRMLAQRVASLAFGDSAAFRRGVEHDAVLRETLARLRRAPTTRALLGLADPRPDAG